MLRPARRSWLLALVLLLGGGAAWLLPRAEHPEAAGTVDAGRTPGASPRPLLLGRDPRAANAEAARSAAAPPKSEQAAWRVLRPDGTPAAGAYVEYRPIDRPDLGYEGSTSDAGLLAVEREAVGERCLVSVREEPAWAQGRFDRFALGVSTLTLSAGCEVWLELDADDADLEGLRATVFTSESGTRSVVLAGVRTRLGRFAGSLTVLQVGRTPAAASLQNVLLPPSGRVTLRFQARPTPPVCRLRLRSPPGAAARPRFTLAALEDVEVSVEQPELRLDVALDVTELAVAPGGLTVLAECEGRWAFAEVLAQPADEPVEVPLDWQTGGELEVRWPTGPPWMVSLELLSDPRTGHRQDLPRSSSDVDPRPGSLHVDWQQERSPAGEWPGFPAREGPRSSLWRGLPRGARVRVWLSETPWGTLFEDATIPLDGGRALLDVGAGARFEVQAVAADGTVLDRLFVLLHGTGEGAFQPQATWTAGGAAQVTGVRPGTEVQVALSDETWAGAATAVVSDGLVLRVPVARRPRARYRARLVDEQGAPLAGLGVSFGADLSAGRLVPSGPDGWAEADLYRDHAVYASSAHPGWTSESVLVAPGGAGTVVARAARDLEVVFDVGDRSVAALSQEVGEDGQAGASSESTLRVLPGSVLRVGVQSRVPRMRVRVEAQEPGGALVLFDEVLRLEPSGTTTVHVRR